MITPHPELVDVFGKLARRGQDNGPDAFVDAGACREYARASREKLELRLTEEQSQPAPK